MEKKILIKKNNEIIQEFLTDDSALDIAIEMFQKKYKQLEEIIINKHPIDYNEEDVIETLQAIEDENGNVITPERVKLRKIYDMEIIDYIDQNEINNNALKFLSETDWKIIRHLGQKALNIQTSISDEEYIALEKARQEARESIKK